MENETHRLGGHSRADEVIVHFSWVSNSAFLRPGLYGYQQTISKLFEVFLQKHLN